MYFAVIAVLSIVLALQTPVGGWVWVRDPGQIVAALALATLLPPAFAAWSARRALHTLDSQPDDPGNGQYMYGRGLGITQLLLLSCHGAVLGCTTWLTLCQQTPVIGHWPAVASLLAVVPFLLSIILIWVVSYPTDRAIRQIAMETYIFRGKPVHPVWSLGRFITYNLRHQVLFVLVPMLLILIARDVIDRYDDWLTQRFRHSFVPDLLLGTAAILVAVIAPAILRHVWVTQPLPDGPLRDRLTWLCRKLKMRCREILVWRSGGMIVNAAVMGIIAPLRYVLITDAMLEQMDDTKVEAVFGHEAGHVKHHHILFFLLFSLISGCMLTILAAHSRALGPQKYEIALLVAGGLLAFKWSVIFGWLSRRFERQADLYGVRTLALVGVPCHGACALHGSAVESEQQPASSLARPAYGPSAGPRSTGPAGAPFAAAFTTAAAPVDSLARSTPLCSSAAHMFGDTLNEVALLNGIPPESRGWRHPSISSRSRFVQEMALHPERIAAFDRGIARIKLAIVLIAAVGTLWAGWELHIWELLGIR